MKICFFGIYNPEYSRNRVLISGFQENGFEVVQCRVDSGVGKFLKYWNLYKEYRKIKDEKFDYVIVAFPGHTVVWLARLLFGKEIIFDAFTSLYDSEVFDRKNVKEGSLKAGYLHFLDWSACRMASKVLLDTDEHIKYFVSEFKINRNKFIRVFVGTDTSVFYPREKVGGGDKFIVHFHGSNIPLQGIKVILESARILEQEKDIQFNIIGTKIKEEYESQNFKNVNFIDNVPYGELPGYISQADICLGIFGATEKTQRVIPNKVYECIAMKKPVITLDTPAVKELFSEGEEIRFLKDPESKELVGKIKELRSHLGSVEFRETFISPKKIVEDLISDLKELKIAIVTPIYKQDYLTDTVLDGLIQLQNRGEKIKFFISSNYKSRLPFKFPRLSEKKFIRFSEKADLILFMWGKNNTNYDLVNKINQWQKTIFIDGSELGGNKRLDNSINQSVLKGDYLGLGRVDKEMLEKCTLYFKREKPYLGEIHPFPFGIENSYLAYNKDIKKDIDFTCVFGQEDFPPLRREVRQELEKYCDENNLKCFTGRTKTPKEFYNILARTKVGVSVSGGGYDTARFWEILGNNCILLTEKIDIFKKEDKKFGYKTIYEFKDLKDFKIQLEKIGEYLKNNYDDKKNLTEFQEIIRTHSSSARVEFILEEARKNGLID